jgi:hypothetical protein
MRPQYAAAIYTSRAKGGGFVVNEGLYIANQLKRMLLMLKRELSGLSDETLNRTLEVQPTNTLFQLGAHVAGSTRFWTITCLGGEDFHRDRDAEFAASGNGVALRSDLDLLVKSVFTHLASFSADQLDLPVSIPSAKISFWPDNEPLPRRHAVLHALEHTGLHVGHAQITRQLMGFPPPGLE